MENENTEDSGVSDSTPSGPLIEAPTLTPTKEVSPTSTATSATKILTPELRENLISSAVRFFQNPNVQSSPLQQKRDFLRSKGLTEQEIDIAYQRAGVPSSPPQPSLPTLPYYPPPPPATILGQTWLRTVRDVLNLAALLGGAAFACYYMWKKYLIHWWSGKSKANKSTAQLNLEASLEIQKSILALNKSVQSLQESLELHCNSLQRLFTESGGSSVNAEDLKRQCLDIKDELRSVKGLMLGTSRFPTNPAIKPIAIPAWQLEGGTDSAAKQQQQEQEHEPRVNGHCESSPDVIND